MSTVRFLRPKPRLARLLKEPGGMSRQAAIRDATRGLAQMEGRGRVELSQRLAAAAEAFRSVGDGSATLDTLGSRVDSIVGVGTLAGAPQVDVAAALLSVLIAQRDPDAEANLMPTIAVHLDALRVLATPNLNPAAGETLLARLREVAGHCAHPSH